MTMDAMCEASIPAPGCLRHHPGQWRCSLSVLPPPRQPVSSSLGAEPHPDHPCLQPQTPHLEEDLKEVLRSEAGIELIIEDEVRPEKQKRKAGVSGWRGRGAALGGHQVGPGLDPGSGGGGLPATSHGAGPGSQSPGNPWPWGSETKQGD